MNLREALIAPHCTDLGAIFNQLLDADVGLEEAAAEKNRSKELLQSYGYGYDVEADTKPFAYADGVAIIPVRGALINRCSWSWGGWITGYNFIRAQLNAALADPDVTSIVLDVDSNGGEAAGCFELCEDIYAARSIKPILAVIDSNCYSAGYAVASSATKVIITPSGGAGSIGVVVCHFNMSAAMEKYGVEVTFIKAGDHKVDGNPYEKMPAEVKASIQANVDLSYDAFVALVVRNRGVTEEVVRGTQAQIYRSAEALALGLVDSIQPPSKALETFTELCDADIEQEGVDTTVPPGSSDNEEELNMEPNQPGADATAANTALIEQAAATARVEERQRMSGITGSEEAKGREALASHIAMNTNMTVVEAKAMLAAAPLAAAPAPAAIAEASPFDAAMSRAEHPGVGADAGAGGGAGEGKEDMAAQILKDQASATGVVRKAKA